MSHRRRRATSGLNAGVEDGPFAAFTDLFIGILFLFLILVAALMLMHQEVVQKVQVEQLKPPPPKPAPPPKPDTRPAFRLGIAFNIYQRSAGDIAWVFARTVRVFRSPDGHCINTVMVRSNLSTAWRPPVGEEDIPTPEQQGALQKLEPCGLSATGDEWDSPTETGRMKRVAPSLYEGSAVLHKKDGDAKVEIQYRVLGVYDDYFR